MKDYGAGNISGGLALRPALAELLKNLHWSASGGSGDAVLR